MSFTGQSDVDELFIVEQTRESGLHIGMIAIPAKTDFRGRRRLLVAEGRWRGPHLRGRGAPPLGVLPQRVGQHGGVGEAQLGGPVPRLRRTNGGRRLLLLLLLLLEGRLVLRGVPRRAPLHLDGGVPHRGGGRRYPVRRHSRLWGHWNSRPSEFSIQTKAPPHKHAYTIDCWDSTMLRVPQPAMATTDYFVLMMKAQPRL